MGMRSQDWIKVKKLEHHTVTITGFDAGSFGPQAVTLFRTKDGTEGRCKTLDADILGTTVPASYIGRRLVVQCQQRMRGSKSLRHPIFDHLAGATE